MVAHYQNGDSTRLEKHSEKALARVWKPQRFSWWMTTMLHTLPGSLAYGQKLQDTDLRIPSHRRRRWGRWWKTIWGAVFGR